MLINRKYFILLVAVLGACQLPLSAAAQGETGYPAQFPPSAVSALSSLRGVQLRPVPGHANAQGWLNPNFHLAGASLHTLYVEPIDVQSAADSPYGNLDPNELATLDRQFLAKLGAQLPSGLKLVTTPQPDSMVVKLVLKQSEMKKDGFHLRNLTPLGFLINHAKAAAGVSKVSFVRMVVSVAAYDAKGEPLWALDMKPQGIPADPGSALDPADADPNRVPMSPVRLDQMPTYLAAKTPKVQAALQALAS